jgi:hypothetical protein
LFLHIFPKIYLPPPPSPAPLAPLIMDYKLK